MTRIEKKKSVQQRDICPAQLIFIISHWGKPLSPHLRRNATRLTHLKTDGTSQELGSLLRIDTVGQMGRRDDQRAHANHVAHGAEHLDLILGVVGDGALVLDVTGEAEERHALNLGLEVVVEGFDRVVDDGGSLAGRNIALALHSYTH